MNIDDKGESIPIKTKEIKQNIGTSIVYQRIDSGFKLYGIIEDVINRQIRISGDWFPFNRIKSINKHNKN